MSKNKGFFTLGRPERGLDGLKPTSRSSGNRLDGLKSTSGSSRNRLDGLKPTSGSSENRLDGLKPTFGSSGNGLDGLKSTFPGNSIWRARMGDGRQPTVPDQETLGYKSHKGAAYNVSTTRHPSFAGLFALPAEWRLPVNLKTAV